MTSLIFDDRVFNREVAFCKVYNLESKEKLEKIFLENRISYYIEWKDRPFLMRIFGKQNEKEKNMSTIRINEADVERATKLVQGMESLKLKEVEEK